MVARQDSGRFRVSRRTLLAGSAAGIAATALGWSHAASVPAYASVARQTSGGTLTYGLGFDVDGTLDPQVTNYDSTIRAILNVCEPLIWMPTATEFKPALADSWDVSDDGLTYTFHLKQGVKFHDGTPFNADAVKYTFDRVVAGPKMAAMATPQPIDPAKIITPGQSFNQIDAYDHAEIVDDHTVKLVLSRPFAPFLSGLNGYLGIVSPTAVEKMGLADFGRAPVGTGPFTFKEWVDKDHITLEKNPDYNWGSSFFKNTGGAQLDELVYKIIPDDSVRTGTLISGETQYIDTIDPLQLADLQDNQDLVVIKQGQPGSGYILLFNVAREGKPAADKAVRQALSWAVDKNALNQAAFGGIFEPAASALMKPTFAYEPKTEQVYSFDAEKAKSLLDAAGWKLNGDVREKDGQKLAFSWPIQDRPNDKAMATFMQGAFRAVGADVNVEPMERGAYRERRQAGDYDIGFLWFSYADPDVLRTIFSSKNIGNFNFANYNNPDVDKWLEDAAASTDDATRKDLYSKVQLQVLDDAVTIPMADSITYNGKQKKLDGDFLDFLASYVWMNDAHFTE